jgi:tripartite-type tricarboxylate transporter receptor subunit TctC
MLFEPGKGTESMLNRRQVLSLAASTALPLHAFAQDAWPTRPIRFIQPSAVGGASDAMCRAVAEPLSASP